MQRSTINGNKFFYDINLWIYYIQRIYHKEQWPFLYFNDLFLAHILQVPFLIGVMSMLRQGFTTQWIKYYVRRRTSLTSPQSSKMFPLTTVFSWFKKVSLSLITRGMYCSIKRNHSSWKKFPFKNVFWLVFV